jgi:membrane fusion protein (multidrug efflux system)
MNPIRFAMRRPVTTLVLVVAIACGGVVGVSMAWADHIPPPDAPKTEVYLHYIGKNAQQAKGYLVGQLEAYLHKHEEQPHREHHKIVGTSPKVRDVVVTQEYVCQIHSQRHINVRALENGYLESIDVKEGQSVKKGDVMFRVIPVLYQAKLDAELAEAQLAQLEFNNTK